MGVCVVGGWLKDVEGGVGSAVGVVVMVARWARRGRRKVGGSVERGSGGW